MSASLTNPKAVAEAGERIYREKFQKEYEKVYLGKFVAINVQKESAHVGDSAEEALRVAREADDKGIFHLMRVGFPSAFQLAHLHPHADKDWIFG